MSDYQDQYLENQDSYAGGGNSKSLVTNGTRLNFFGNAAIKEGWRGTVLPPFDTSRISNPMDTESYIETVAPCWSEKVDEQNPRFFLPNSWSRKFLVYTFLGSSNTHFWSPRIRRNFVPQLDWSEMDLADPFDDIRFFVKNSKAFTEQQRKALTERTKQGDRYVDAPIPQASFRHLLFCEQWTNQHPNPRVELNAITASAYKHLIDQMRWFADPSQPSIGRTFTQYLLGDPFDPEGALVWTPQKRVIGDFGEANVMAYTQQLQLTRGAERRPISREALRQRFLLADASYWNIASYQDMVDFAVNELTGIPIDIIKRACSNRANVGERSASNYSEAETFGHGESGYDPMAQARGNAAAADRYAAGSTPVPQSQPVQQAVPMNTVPVAQTVPVANEPTYLSGAPGSAPAQRTAGELAALFAASPGAMVNLNGVWTPISASGLLPAQPAAVPAAVPATVPVETVPVAQPVPQSVPVQSQPVQTTPVAQSTPVAAVGEESILTYRNRICDDERYQRLTPAGKTEVDDLANQLFHNRNNGGGMTTELMRRVSVAARPDYLG